MASDRPYLGVNTSKVVLLPLTNIKCQSPVLSFERYGGPLWKVHHVPRVRSGLLTSRIGNGVVAFEEDLHLVIFVGVGEGLAFL